MKNKFYIYFIAVIAAAYAIINILIFVLVPYDYLANPQFWVSWSFMFVGNTVATVVLGCFLKKKHQNDIRFFPVTLICGGNLVYFVLGLIFTIFAQKISVLYVVMVDLVVAIVYAVLILRCILAFTYIRGNDAHRRKKISYIRQLTSMVESYASLASDADTSDLIKKLASDFRYSDPMSDDSLAGIEQKLMAMVVDFEEIVRGGDENKIKTAADEIKRELKYRNAQCMNLK